MIIKKLHITNLRAYKEAEFEFQPGMNLLVGINGVGKTTALEALQICLSQILPEITVSKNRKENFSLNDIKIGSANLQVSCDFEIDDHEFNLLIHRQKETIKPKAIGAVRDQVEETPDIEKISPSLKATFSQTDKQKNQPVGIFFSTRRSLMIDREPAKAMSVGGQAAAFAEALSINREFNLRIFTDWIRTQIALGKENPLILKSVEVLGEAVYRFLPGFSNLQLKNEDGKYTLTIDKGETTLHINQLSDGERGILALVMDIARRLYQANPRLKDPLKEGKAVVLIDELDLHLHPKWQRSIVENLTRVFPNCQFIATSHSPQIIPALEPEKIHIINRNEIIRPNKSRGLDTNWILKHLMESDDRPEISVRAIEEVERLIDDIEFDQARELIDKYKSEGLDISEWVIFEARMSNLEILGEDDEEDS